MRSVRRDQGYIGVERRSDVRVPFVRVASEAPGPVAVVTANVHGDECTGVAAAHALADLLARTLRRGEVVLYPTLNPTALAAGTRTVPGGADLNRVFPGRATGGLAERLAAACWTDLARRAPDLVVDLHADSGAAIPYAIVDRPVAHTGAARLEMEAALGRLAEATGLTVVREYPDEEYVRFSLDRSLAGAVVNVLRVPAVTVEAGPRRLVDPGAVEVAVRAVLGVLAASGLVDPVPTGEPTRRAGGPWRRAPAPKARHDGLFVPALAPGAVFARDAVLGTIWSPIGASLDEVRAPAEGIVLSWSDGGWVVSGAVVGTLGVREGAT